MKTLTLCLFLCMSLSLEAGQRHFFNLSLPTDTQNPAPVRVRFQHFWFVDDVRVDGGTVDAQLSPGDTGQVNLEMLDVEYGSFIELQRFTPAPITVGNSFVDNGAGDWVYAGEIWSHDIGGPPSYSPPVDVTHTVDLSNAAGITVRPLPTSDAKKTLWIVADEELTADLYREGVDKIVAAAGSSSGGTPPAGGMTRAEFVTTDANQNLKLQNEIAADNPTPLEMQGESLAAREAAEAAVTQTVPTLGTKALVTEPTSILAFTIPHVGAISLDPADVPLLDTYADFVKLITGWALLTAFSWWSWTEFQNIIRGTVTVTQARGNPVLGGTGAQATALIAAGIIAVIFVGIPAAYWATVTVDTSALSSNPFTAGSSVVTTGLYILGLVFPYDLALTLLAAAFVIRRFGSVMILGVNAAVKFIVP